VSLKWRSFRVTLKLLHWQFKGLEGRTWRWLDNEGDSRKRKAVPPPTACAWVVGVVRGLLMRKKPGGVAWHWGVRQSYSRRRSSGFTLSKNVDIASFSEMRVIAVVRRCGVVGSILAFGSIGHGFESEHRIFSIYLYTGRSFPIRYINFKINFNLSSIFQVVEKRTNVECTKIEGRWNWPGVELNVLAVN